MDLFSSGAEDFQSSGLGASINYRSFTSYVRILNLSYNQIQRIEEGAFDGMPYLVHLNLKGNLLGSVNPFKITSGLFPGWSGVNLTDGKKAKSCLRSIDFSNNSIQILETGCFNHLRSLESVDFAENQIESLPLYLTNNPQNRILSLNLSKNPIGKSSFTKNGAEFLRNLPNLIELNMNQINVKKVKFDQREALLKYESMKNTGKIRDSVGASSLKVPGKNRDKRVTEKDGEEEDNDDGDTDSDIYEDSFIGSSVRKYFEGHGVFDGNVIGNRRVRNKCLYKVRYSDGDVEEYEEEELLELLV